MVPIKFRLDKESERIYIDKVLMCFKDGEKEKSSKEIGRFLNRLNGRLRRNLRRRASAFVSDYPTCYYLCMWIVLPYEQLQKIKRYLDKVIKKDFVNINSCMKKYKREQIKSYHDLLLRRKKLSKKPYKEPAINKILGAKRIEYDDIYDDFALFLEKYKKFIDKKFNQWIIEITGFNVCPYCNIVYTYNRGADVTAQLDHFFPKSEYPMFAVCFYNLIPSCPACNKLKLDGMEELASPYKYGAFEDLHIRWTFSGNADKSTLGELEEMIKLEISSSDVSEEKNIEKMKLRQAYERHRDYAGEMIKKVRIYSNKYTQEWISSIFDRGSGEKVIAPEEIERFYFSNYLQEEKFNKRPLSKMTKDIFKEYSDE